MPAPCCSYRRETGAPSRKAASARGSDAGVTPQRQKGGRRGPRESPTVAVDMGSEEHYAARRRVKQRSAIT